MISVQTVIVFGLLVGMGMMASCPLKSQQQPQIVSDTVGLSAQSNNMSSTQQNLVYNYQFKTPFTTTPNIAIGLNQIQSLQSSIFDIRINNPKITRTGIDFTLQSGQHSEWKNCQINFMVSNRNDMQLGSTSIINPIINNNDNSFNMIYNMNRNISNNGLKIKTFIQGLNMISSNQSNKIGLKQQSNYLSGKQIFLSFTSTSEKNFVKSVIISIIAFNVNTPSVLYADGTIDQNFVISTMNVVIPRHGINQLRTYIVGINSFVTNTMQPISISAAIDETFSLVIGPIDRTQIDFVSVSYLILSIVDCGSCEGNPLLFDGLCQPICPYGYKASLGKCIPSRCLEGQIFDMNNNCVSMCSNNEIYTSGTCICIDGYYRINGVCGLCDDGYRYDFKQLICKPICTENSNYNNGKCLCNDGYYMINKRCQNCAYGTSYNSNTKSCSNLCGDNEVYSPGGCVCINNYNRVNGSCQRCPYLTVYEESTMSCVCGKGLELVYGQCVAECKNNQVRVDGTCVCAPGLLRISGVCGVCPGNSSFNNILQQCICNQNFNQIGGICLPNCTSDQYFSDGKCIPYCKQYIEYFNNGKCTCYDDYQRIDGICIPKCLQYESRINGICQCLKGYFKTSYSPVCQVVNCPAGTSFDYVRGDCISICMANQVYINGQCVCQYGFNINSRGDCTISCSAVEININGVCQCQVGYIRVGQGICIPQITQTNTQSCNQLYVFGQCTAPQVCAGNQYWNGVGCSCMTGYYMVNNQCTTVLNTISCPPNSVFNGVNCQCMNGYFPSSPGSCLNCPAGTYWNGAQCIRGNGNQCLNGCVWDPIQGNCLLQNNCGANQYWNGINCRCKQGTYSISGRCSQCPLGSVFDGFKCSPRIKQSNCLDAYSFWNGNSCVCIPGYWQIKGGMCIICPDGTSWDGMYCKQRGGKPIPITTC